MKLPAYNIDLILSDPDDPETKVKIHLERVPREKIQTLAVPLAGALQMMEASIV